MAAMLKLVTASLVGAICIQAQTYQDRLLPQAIHISGLVVDSAGMPVGDARVEHTGDRIRAYQTDSKGRFEFDTRAPALVVRKEGFQAQLVRPAENVRVVMQTDRATWSLPTCSGKTDLIGLDLFKFPRTTTVAAGETVFGVDYRARDYVVKTDLASKKITHGKGPSWSFGMPSDFDIWPTVQYEERTYQFGRFAIRDARGQVADGARWRYLGTFGESAFYNGVDDSTAAVLDRFLDSVCLGS